MVVSRPSDAGFLDPRSSAVALLDALAPLGDNAVVEFLRPPTVGELSDRLRNPELPRVHVVHFDGHGVYRPAVGLGYLAFETPDHALDLADADRLGTLLKECGVPLILLDACQTGDAGGRDAFSSVAAQLIQAGVGSVLAMNYSVLVETTRRLTAAFFRELAGGGTVGQALDASRLDLLKDTARHRLYRPAEGREEIIQLHDWFLPVLYQQHNADPAPFGQARPVAAGAAPAPLIPRQPARGGFPPEPRHGFHGRARELLDLERAFAGRRIVVLHGFGGEGKTALATQAAGWLVRTGLFRRAAFLSFEHGGSLELALSELGEALVGPDFKIHEGDPAQAIAGSLAATPTLVVWDNFESLLPGGDAPLSPAGLVALLGAGANWAAQGGSRLLVTTRDISFGHPAFEPSATGAHLRLGGLIAPEALELAGQVLADRGIPRPGREGLEELLRFLGGHPLSLQLVLPHLADPEVNGDADKLVAEFEALLPGFREGKAAERNESLELSLDFSLRRLGERTREMLPALAVFAGLAMEDDLLAVTEFDPELWRAVRAELERAGLVTLERVPGVVAPYIHFHPTLAPHLACRLAPERRRALEERFRERYAALADYLYHADEKTPAPARALAARDRPNLRRALELLLAAGEDERAVRMAGRIAWFLDAFGRWQERDELLARVGPAAQPAAGGELTKAEYLLACLQGEALFRAGRLADAEGVFRRLLGRLEAGAAFDCRFEHCHVLGRLGRSVFAQSRPGEAVECFGPALAELTALEHAERFRDEAGALHADLGNALLTLGRHAEARAQFEAALLAAREAGDQRNTAAVAAQLGMLAQVQGDLAEARRRYQGALREFQALGEAQAQATCWHQLGIVAQEAQDWPEAQHCYRESLAIEDRLADKAGAASTCNQLGQVARLAGRPAEAARWFRRALADFEELGLAGGIATMSSNLAALLIEAYDSPDGPRPDLDGAEGYAEQALRIMERLGPSSELWRTYGILARIAEQRGQPEGTRDCQRRAQESFAAFPGNWAGLERQFGQLVAAVAAAARGVPGAREAVEGSFEALRAGDWQLAAPIQRIWAGERDVWALTEGLDPQDALIVRKMLEALADGAAGEKTGEGSPSRETGEPRQPEPASATQPTTPPAQAEPDADLGLVRLAGLVLGAIRGTVARAEAEAALKTVARHPAASSAAQCFAINLFKILALDDRDAAELSRGLPPELARQITALLAELQE
jgi:tetratricopeptide (TPR) repeat protein